MKQIEKYDNFQVTINNFPKAGLVEYCAVLINGAQQQTIPVYRSGENQYTLSFMPQATGLWTYHIKFGDLDVSGDFECVAQTGANHGPVVACGEHFAYADGARFIPFGTTCYAWVNQSAQLQEETLKTLGSAPFNKIRMCVFPKSMPYNNNDPDHYPFHKNPDGSWNVEDLDFAFWDNLEQRIMTLRDMAIEADLILFHPYDRWGFAALSQKESLAYLEYCIARFAPYRNIWWSLANEYEMLYEKTMDDWDEYGDLLMKKDPYKHLISVHNIFKVYPKRDWMTHCSIQSGDIHNVLNWRQEYHLPVLIDECGYEGDIEYDWGNLSAFEMVHRVWWTVCRGGFCTHGETFHREDEVLWWAKGGKLYGESPKRIGFLKELLYSLPGEGDVVFRKFEQNPNVDPADAAAVRQEASFQALMDSLPEHQRKGIVSATPMVLKGSAYQLRYFGRTCPCHCYLDLSEEDTYDVQVIDIWEMTRETAAQQVNGRVRIALPAKEGIAVLALRTQA